MRNLWCAICGGGKKKDDKKTKAVIKQGEAQTCVSLKSVNGVKYSITEGDTLGKGRGRGQGVNYLKLR